MYNLDYLLYLIKNWNKYSITNNNLIIIFNIKMIKILYDKRKIHTIKAYNYSLDAMFLDE